jgi:putative ABC transport system ATP-binding protein
MQAQGKTHAEKSAPIIFARGLTRIYHLGSTEVVGLNRVDLEVPAGQLVVLKGESGSGKSTLLSLLAGLDRPTAGRLRVAGIDLERPGDRHLTRFRREVVGMVFQSFNLLPTLNVLENICLPALLAGACLKHTEQRAGRLLQWLDMAHRRRHLPSQLSGGEMQRTAIARALINRPAIVLADEPTGNLDSRNGQAVIELLAELNRTWQTTVVIATHSAIADPRATMRLYLKDGNIVQRP